MPFPSTACHTCKIRRIKCDENKPTCQRCAKSRRVCLQENAGAQASFSIHVENSYASGKTKRPRGPRSSLTILRPHLDLQTRALAYYLQYHLQTLTDVPKIGGGLSECVSEWKVSGRTCPMVDLALSSMALAIFSKTHKYPPAAASAYSKYYRLLQITQDRITQLTVQTLDEQSIEACLLAVSLMGRYEGATYRPGGPTSKDPFTSLLCWSHHDGCMAILKLWNDNLSHKTASFIIKHTRRGLIRSCLLRNLPLPDWMQDGSRFGEYDPPELVYDRIMVRLANLHHEFASLRKKSLCIQVAHKLNEEARDLDRALRDWASQVPSTCSYKEHTLPKPGPWPKRHFYSSIVYSYPRPGYASAWCQLFAMKLLIGSVRSRALEVIHQNELADFTYEQQRHECITELKATADNLASSVPFCIERFKVNSPTRQGQITLNANDEIKPYLATLVVWPLTIASSLEGIDTNHHLWFKSELASLGRITGDGILECAETDQWARL